jgi:hypothetical protein
VNAQTIERSRLEIGDVTVPDVLRDLGQVAAVDLALRIVGIVEANLDSGRHPREDREVHAAPVEGGAEGIGFSGPGLSHRRTKLRLLLTSTRNAGREPGIRYYVRQRICPT